MIKQNNVDELIVEKNTVAYYAQHFVEVSMMKQNYTKYENIICWRQNIFLCLMYVTFSLSPCCQYISILW